MARPKKNNCDYFPHLTTMRNHKKVKAIRNKFGQVLGYAFWAMILEYLTEQDGNEFEFSDIELEMFAGELGVSATEIRDMISFCVLIELLFITEDNFIYSDSLNESLKPVYEKRNKAKDLSKTRKRRDNGSFCDDNIQTLGVSVTEMPQSKVEYSKVDESKEEAFNFKKSLIELGVEKQIASDWFKVRQKKSATNTITSFNRIKKQIELSGKTANECITIAVEKDWKGFEAEWITNKNKSNGNDRRDLSKIDHSTAIKLADM